MKNIKRLNGRFFSIKIEGLMNISTIVNAMNVKQQSTQTVLSDYITVEKLDDIKVIRITHPKATAVVSLFGGQVLSFQPTGKKETIWISDNADFSGNKALRGGIPICWPWFGKAAEPSHGFVRTRQWTLHQHRENNHGVILSLTLQDCAETRVIWPHAFHLELLIDISDTLTVSLISTNTGATPIQIGGALHSYFNVSEISHVAVSGLGNEYLERDEKHICSKKVQFDQEVDRIYTHPEETVVIDDPEQPNNIKISNSGHNAVILWNPWSFLSTSMADMTDDGYRSMVCIESCIYDRSITLHPDERHILSTTISHQK